jgi:hypothetical protein
MFLPISTEIHRRLVLRPVHASAIEAVGFCGIDPADLV